MTDHLRKKSINHRLVEWNLLIYKNDCSDSSQDEKTKDIKSTFESSIWCSYWLYD